MKKNLNTFSSLLKSVSIACFLLLAILCINACGESKDKKEEAPAVVKDSVTPAPATIDTTKHTTDSGRGVPVTGGSKPTP